MTISKGTVLKTAKLARLKIPEDKIDLYTKEISNIVDLIDTLNEVDTKGVETLVNVDEFSITTQKDEITAGNCADKILKNAPKEKLGYFVVPKVIE
jgi:aspartyl-tRNA(Asn)/glutamyl-tRNA(Gln) amidotransferase subunit C